VHSGGAADRGCDLGGDGIGARLRGQAAVVLEVEDAGVGFRDMDRQGMGLISMRERAELVNGHIEFLEREGGGALVRITVPMAVEEAHAAG